MWDGDELVTPSSLRNLAMARSLNRHDPDDEPHGDGGRRASAERSLAERLAASDRDALESVFRRLSEPVFRYVSGMMEDEATARDITQDTFLRLWSAREELADVESLPAYVFRMARNRVYDRERDERARRDRRSRIGTEAGIRPGGPADPDESLEARELRELLESWIEDLPDRQREALVLSRREALSHEEIGGVMGISPHTVNNHIVSGLKKLRRRARQERPELLP